MRKWEDTRTGVVMEEKKRAHMRDRWGGGWCLRVVQQHRYWT